LIAFVYFYPNFSEKLLLLGVPWAITAPAAMLFIAISLHKKLQCVKFKKCQRAYGKNED